MSDKAKEILNNVYEAFNKGEDYTIKTPSSSEIHSFNMAIKEIEDYIVFTERNMVKISITLSEKGLEYFV